MKYNNEFEIINTPEKAYVLGQMYGDGYNFCGPHNRFSMSSNMNDVYLYSQIHDIFPFLKLKFYKSHPNMVYLECYNKKFCNDLKNLGLLSPKVKNDAIGDFVFPTLKEEFISHFIRGYFDADGSAYYLSSYRSRNNLRIDFGCGTKNFLLKIDKILKENDIYFSYRERIIKVKGKSYNVYNLTSSNRKTSLKFANYIYKDSTLCLHYKKETCYRKPYLLNTTFEIFGECPYCHSSEIIKIGKRDNKQRLKCNNCKKSFSKPLPK